MTKKENPTSSDSELKAELNKHCITTAISAVNRACDFRINEINDLVEKYLEMLPPEIKKKKVNSF